MTTAKKTRRKGVKSRYEKAALENAASENISTLSNEFVFSIVMNFCLFFGWSHIRIDVKIYQIIICSIITAVASFEHDQRTDR